LICGVSAARAFAGSPAIESLPEEGDPEQMHAEHLADEIVAWLEGLPRP
jgi:hypothetical protein